MSLGIGYTPATDVFTKGTTMKRSTLSPSAHSWLDQTIARNRAMYGGFQMKDDGGDTAGQQDADTADGKPAGDDGGDGGKEADTGLGEGGKKAIQAERDRAKAAEDAAKATRTELENFKTALGAALGIKSEDDKTDQQKDLLANVQKQIEDMQREAAVLKLANAHRITDEDDLALLQSATDDEARKRLAERLAPTADEQGDKSTRRTGDRRPTRTQGTDDDKPASSGVSHGRELFQSSRGKKDS